MIDLGKWAFNNQKLIWFLVAVLLVGGIHSAYEMSKLEDPEIRVKIAMVVATRPGASPSEMELEVTDPLEKAIRTIGEVKYVQSWSRSDVAILQVELKPTIQDKDLEQCWDMLRRKVNDKATQLPAGTSVIVQDDFNLVYGMFYALTTDGYSERELSDYATLIQRELTDLEGVGRVLIYGEREESIDITLLPKKMASLGVSPAEVLSTLQGHNNVYYAGYYNNGTRRLRVTVADKFHTVEQIGKMIIQGHEDDQLRLCDIATIENGYAEPVRNQMKYNGDRALGIAVAAASGTDIVKVGKAVEQRLAELSEEQLPVGVVCNKIFYQPERVTDALMTFFINLIESIVIVIVVLMLTMGLRSGIIIGISLLTIVIGTFLILGFFDGSMQRVSLGAFILAMGMLVDNAIVIIDGILVDLKQGKPRKEAMTAIGRKTAMPLLGATFIAILAFFPIFLSPDTAGVYVRDLFIVLAVSLLLSWVLALTHVPLMADKWLKIPIVKKEDKELYSSPIYRVLRSSLLFCLRHRWTVILSGVVLIVASVFGIRYMKQGFFPDMTYDQLYIEYKLPERTNYTQVEQDLKQIEKYLKTHDEITDITTAIGGTPARYNLVRSIATPSLSYGELIVSFTSAKALNQHIAEIQHDLTKLYPDAYLKLKKYNIMYKKYPIELQVIGPDPAILNSLSDTIRKIMLQTPEVSLVTSDWDEKAPLLEVDYNQLLARRAGVNREDISMSLLTATDGIPIGRFYEGRKENTIYLKCMEENGQAIDNLDNVPIFSMLPNINKILNDDLLLKVKSGTINQDEILRQLTVTTPLTALGSGVNIGWEYPTIARYNGQRAQTIMCSPIEGIETEAARLKVESKVEQIILPEGYSFRWGGEKEAKDQTMHYLFKQVPLGIILIIAVLILLFKDYSKPALIFCCIPLLIVGIVAGMLLSGKVFNFCAIVGALGLMGMLIKNCIVLMDEINAQIEAGVSSIDALIESSCSRLRPVMMASLTTILGMIPLLSDDLFGSLAVTIMGGLLFSTFATLVYLPILYALFFKIKIK